MASGTMIGRHLGWSDTREHYGPSVNMMTKSEILERRTEGEYHDIPWEDPLAFREGLRNHELLTITRFVPAPSL